MKKRSKEKRDNPYYYNTSKTVESLNQNSEVIKSKPNGRFNSNICNYLLLNECFKGTCKHIDKEK